MRDKLPKVETHETSKLLELGEKLRENPETILLCVPVFLVGAIWFSLKKDNRKIAGSFGHLGIAFKNYYKHHLKLKFFLRLAAGCFAVSAKYASLKDKLAVLVQSGQTWVELGKLEVGENIFNEAVKIAKKVKDYPQMGYILSHRGKLYILQKKMNLAWQDLKKAQKYIEDGVKKRKSSLYYQIWLSAVELGLADYYLELGRKNEALEWAEKAKKRAEKFNLKTRKLDAKTMLGKIGKVMAKVVVWLVALGGYSRFK